MEWTGRQQIYFLLQSASLGFAIGVMFEVCNGIGRCMRRWPARFIWDALFGFPAALVTFFGALVIMDGHLHPLLFLGCSIGLITERMTLGRCLTPIIAAVACILRRGVTWLLRGEEKIWGKYFAFLASIRHKKEVDPAISKKISKKAKKISKKS